MDESKIDERESSSNTRQAGVFCGAPARLMNICELKSEQDMKSPYAMTLESVIFYFNVAVCQIENGDLMGDKGPSRFGDLVSRQEIVFYICRYMLALSG